MKFQNKFIKFPIKHCQSLIVTNWENSSELVDLLFVNYDDFVYYDYSINSESDMDFVEENIHKMQIRNLKISQCIRNLSQDRFEQWMYTLKSSFLNKGTSSIKFIEYDAWWTRCFEFTQAILWGITAKSKLENFVIIDTSQDEEDCTDDDVSQ